MASAHAGPRPVRRANVNAQAIKIRTLQSKFRAVMQDLSTVILERDEAIRNGCLALICGEHYVMFGGPGIAKSMLVDQIVARIEGANKFRIQLTATTEPMELLGPPDYVKLADRDNPRFVRNRARSLTEAHIAFLDETFNCNSHTLKSLQQVMNERWIEEIGFPERIHAKIISVFGATNEEPKGKDLAAFNDRFLFRENIVRIQSPDNWDKVIMMDDPPAPQAFLTLEDIQDSWDAARQVDVPKAMRDMMRDLKETLIEKHGIEPSDRSWRKSRKALQARAWLEGLDQVDAECLNTLRHTLWRHRKDEPAVRKLVYEYSSSLSVQALEIEDKATQLFKAVPTDRAQVGFKDACEDGNKKLHDYQEQLLGKITTAIQAGRRDHSQAFASINAIERMRDTLTRRYLGDARYKVMQSAGH